MTNIHACAYIRIRKTLCRYKQYIYAVSHTLQQCHVVFKNAFGLNDLPNNYQQTKDCMA